ncbi:M23 family metallopeptidase [bacterium]|nr:M23 family metallopeptidase [bacterium]
MIQFVKPVQGRTSTGYGLRRYYNDDPEPEFHKGIDIASWNGCNVVAPQNAVVVMAKENLILHGNVIVLDHGRGVGSLYLHLGSISVKEGQYVKQGQVIGTIGSSGASTGPHLHWATYSHGVPVNPWQLFALPSSWIK